MKRDRFILIFVVIFIIFVIGLNIYERVKTVTEIDMKASPAKIIDIQHFDENKSTAIKYKFSDDKKLSDEYINMNNVAFNNRLLVNPEYETQSSTSKRDLSTKVKTNYFYLYIYDISSSKAKLIKKIDVYEKMKHRFSKDNLHIVYRGTSIDKDYYYAEFGIYSSDDKKIDSAILYDITQDKWIVDDTWTFDKYTQKTLPEELYLINKTNFSDLWFKNSNIDTYGQFILLSSNSNNTTFNIDLFSQYPELNKINQINKDECLGLFFTEKMYTNDSLSLFVPTGKNPYDGLVLDKNNSNDGQEHEIHSFEDYKKYSR